MLTAVFVVLLSLLVLLAIPLTFTFQVAWPNTTTTEAELKWAFGLVRLRSRPSKDKPHEQKDEKSRKTKPKRPKTGKRQHFFAAARNAAFRRRLFRFASELWQAIQKNKLRLNVRLGLGDPADTGQLWTLVGPVAGVLGSVRGARISIEPEFFDTTFEVDSSGSIRLVPLQLVFLTVALLLSPPFWQGVKQIRGGNR